jgi:hypothetical protein
MIEDLKLPLWKANLILKAFGILKVPMILYTGAKIEEISASKTVIKIPLTWRTKNHLGSMYFGALCVGADLCAGLYSALLIHESKKKVHLSFKEFKATFKKRPVSNNYFLVKDNQNIKKFVESVIDNPGKRQNLDVQIISSTDKSFSSPEDVNAEFVLTLSLKASE